jgi:hypothetical protein
LEEYMKKTVIFFQAVILLIGISVIEGAGYAQQTDMQATPAVQNAAVPNVNVNGVWDGREWGKVTLNQAPGSCEIIGDGDGWRIDGVVSGKNVYLAFSHRRTRRVEYTAKLVAESENKLVGEYVRGMLTEKADAKNMILTK